MANKSGGDNVQIQTANQESSGFQSQNSVAAGGTAALGSMGANALSAGLAEQVVHSALQQAAGALGGYSGDDNINSNTNVNIS